jgi:PleD family two-component response regulator
MQRIDTCQLRAHDSSNFSRPVFISFEKWSAAMSEVDVNQARLLIVDDEPEIRNVLHDFLCESYRCEAVGSAEEALARLSTEEFDLIISDITMKGMSGLEFVPYSSSS